MGALSYLRTSAVVARRSLTLALDGASAVWPRDEPLVVMIHEQVCWVILCMYFDKQMDPPQTSELLWTPQHDISTKSVERIVDRFESTGQVCVCVLPAHPTLSATFMRRSAGAVSAALRRNTSMWRIGRCCT